MTAYRITMHRNRRVAAVCGAIVDGNRIVEIAPYLWRASFNAGRRWSQLSARLRAWGAEIEELSCGSCSSTSTE